MIPLPAPAAAALAAALAAAGAIASLAVPRAADAASHAHCSASASPKHPADNSDVDIAVNSNVNHGKVHTVAHYASTDTAHTKKANVHGNATVVYAISRATPGFKVKVDVTVTRKHRQATCSTSFTPR